VLDVSRITTGKLKLRMERVELAAVVQSTVETTRPLIDEQGHYLSVRLPPTPILLDADPTRLAQVFSNLLNNAAKYSDQGGHITLSGEPEGDEVIVRVTDRGIGFPPITCRASFSSSRRWKPPPTDRKVDCASGYRWSGAW
jgi:signal transduction histidine kinase